MSQPKKKPTRPSKAIVRTPKPAAGPRPAGSAADVAASAGAQRAYERFVSAAEAVPAADIVPMRADPRVALQNAQTMSSALLEEKSAIARELPTLSIEEVAELPQLALAAVFAAVQVDRGAGASTGEIAKKLARAGELRMFLLTTASGLSLAGLIPKRAVEKIREGRGAIDVAQDCVDCAALFRKYPDATRKSAVTAAQVHEAAELGTELLVILQPRRAKAKSRTPDAVVRAVELRDRLWTLLVKSHDRAWRAGIWLFGRGSEDRVPLLLAHSGAGKKPAPKIEKPTMPAADT